MVEHILVKFAKRFKFSDTPDLPDAAKYDKLKSVWTLGNRPLVLSNEYAGKPVTKKCDLETGEDLKGE